METGRIVPQSLYPTQLETRADGTKTISGYAVVFYQEGNPKTEYQLRSDAVERIMPNAFNDGIPHAKKDVVATFDHKRDTVLGRLSNNTLKMTVDTIGLRYEVPFDANDPDHQRVAAKIERGDITGSSCGFYVSPMGQKIERSGDKWVRNLTSITLDEVGPVVNPAYKATTTGLRSADDASEAITALDAEKERLDLLSKHQEHRKEMLDKISEA